MPFSVTVNSYLASVVRIAIYHLIRLAMVILSRSLKLEPDAE